MEEVHIPKLGPVPTSQLCGWGVRSGGMFDHDATKQLVRDSFDLWGGEADPSRIYPRLNIVGAAPYKAGQRSMLWEVGRKLLGTDPLNYPQQIGDCFIAGTMVTMGDGSEKPIEDISVGNYVLSHSNRPRKVTRIIKKKYTGELCTMKVKGCARTITSTPDHQFVHMPYKGYRFSFSDYDWKAVSDLDKGDRVLMPFGLSPEECSIDLLEWPSITVLTSDVRLGRLIGLYLAEGGVSYTKKTGTPVRVDFSLNKDEVLLAEEIIFLLNEMFGVRSKIVRMPSKPNVIMVRADNTKFAKFIKSIIPGNVYSKRIPEFFFRTTRQVRLSLIQGWMDGDGHLPPQGSLQTLGVTSSSGLLHDMYRLALTCELRPKSAYRKREKHQRVASGSMHLYGEECVQVYPELKDDRTLKLRHIKIDRTPFGIAAKVGKITRKYVEDVYVYCLEVEEEHSFQANGFAVHNCVSFGAKNAIEYVQFFPMINGERLNWTMVFPPYLYGCGRIFIGKGQIGNEDGSLGAWQAKAVMEYGAVRKDEPGLPEYSGQVARQWGSGAGPDKKWVELGKQHIVKSAAAVATWEDLVQSLTNGYPVSVASNVGFDMKPRADGFHHYSTHWGHNMCITGVDDDASEPHAGVLNNWGDCHGEIKDFKTGEIWPKGMLRVRKADVEAMLKEGDSFAYSSFTGFPAQSIDRDKFDLW